MSEPPVSIRATKTLDGGGERTDDRPEEEEEGEEEGKESVEVGGGETPSRREIVEVVLDEAAT
jgi:hypothetical protein